jgi:acetyl esterase/lipase
VPRDVKIGVVQRLPTRAGLELQIVVNQPAGDAMNRIDTCRAAALCAMILLVANSTVAADLIKRTFVYKQVGELQIHADVYREDDGALRPIVVWIHGGALIMGHREGLPARLKEAMLDAGCAVVSIDYRLAPETSLPQIVADVEDALRWLHERAERLFQGDASRMAIAGGSAGGYLTLTAGFRAKPRPAALVSFWGYGDLVGAWYSEPSPHARHNSIKVTREKAWQQVSATPVADARDRRGDGGLFYLYCRQTGTWPKAVSGWDPRDEREKFIPYMPVHNVTADYPPTLLIHGQADTDVPHEQSEMMARELARHKVVHRFVSLPNAEHGLDGGDKAQIDAAYAEAFRFLRDKLGIK